MRKSTTTLTPAQVYRFAKLRTSGWLSGPSLVLGDHISLEDELVLGSVQVS